MKAYPYQHKNPTSGLVFESEGMDLRDYFAAKAMQGLFSHKPWQVVYSPKDIAKESYEIADAMMKAREVKHEQG